MMETHHQTILEAWIQVSHMVHPVRVKINLSGECGRRRVDNHGSAVLRRRGAAIQVFLGTSARMKSDSVGEPAPGGPGEVPH